MYSISEAAGKLGIGEKFLKEHINVFYRDFSSNVERIRGIMAQSDFDKIYFEFHRLKSTFRMISAAEAEDICRECCDLSREKVSSEYPEAFEKVVLLFENLHRQINGEA
ncbi:Hpt domain-containing protein [Spirochaeta isovalerica]|uniref:HPt (Histidine-containing phosphotransfer) domain-containing protein n=1 Tax=Spirochaeta isovalerica TaxID=150 RepID=A0A841R9M3_9SPIO|nr:Hpt domain-containing protein [Spirochaeta isovalerica]MBB6479639.1 HPt (histidine-containing phosphotransfer) domain-containing protein [Spirochaeta isovalerica]